MRIRIAAVVAVAGLALAGCSSAAAPRTASTRPASPVTATSAATASPSAEVIAARMGLTKAPGYVAYTASTDPNHLLGRQNGYTSKINWGPDGNTGTIEVSPIRPTPSPGRITSRASRARSGSVTSPCRALPTCAWAAT